MNLACYHWATETSLCKEQNLLIYKVCMKMGTFLVLDIPKVPSDSTIWELRKSIFGIFGIKNLSRLDSRDMCLYNVSTRVCATKEFSCKESWLNGKIREIHSEPRPNGCHKKVPENGGHGRGRMKINENKIGYIVFFRWESDQRFKYSKS